VQGLRSNNNGHNDALLNNLGRIPCLAPVLGRRRLLRIRALAQDSPLSAQVVEEEQDIPLAQAEERRGPPASGVSEGEAEGEKSEDLPAFPTALVCSSASHIHLRKTPP
jgi:hypothetical protein